MVWSAQGGHMLWIGGNLRGIEPAETSDLTTKKYVDDNAGGGTHASTHEVGGDDLVDHDLLTNFLSNEHIDWTSTSSNLSTSGTAALGASTITGQLVVNDTTFPVAKFVRVDRTSDTIWGTFSGKAIKTTNMGDGFGSAFICFIEDNAAVENAVGFFGAVRDGADNTGKVILSAYNLGTFSTSDFVLDKDGNIGIGLEDPAFKIDVLSPDNAICNFQSTQTDYSRIIVNGGTGADTQISFQNAGSTKWSIGNDADTDALTIRTGLGEFGTNDKLILLSTGELGIATVTPVTTLDINGGFAANLVAKTGTYTATTSDHTIICGAGNESFTVTLPAVSGLAGIIYNIKNVGTGTITIDGASSETIDGATTQVINTQYDSLTIQCDGVTWWII